MKVFFFDRTGGACDYYRVILPLKVMAEQDKSIRCKTMTRADLMIAIETDDHTKIMELLDADVIVLPRLAERQFFENIKKLNSRAQIVLEYDDNLFEVSPLSPHYADHGTEEVSITLPGGDIVKLWEDGKNINLAKNLEALEAVKWVCGQADMVTTTTEILADVYREYSKKVVALPNCIDKRIWQKLPLKLRHDVRMGWFGGHSHYEDWILLKDVLPVVMKQNPHMKLVLMGAKFDGTLKDIPQDRIEFHPWTELAAYPYKAAILDLDFAIIPLRNTIFNRCKSNIKWVEMGSLEVPAVTSYFSPYKEAATEGNGVWIEDNDPKAWIDGINLLANDPKLRSQIGAEAKRTVYNDFEISGKAHLWANAFREVIKHGFTNAANLSKSHT